MIIVQCPQCHSKFRFSHDGLDRNTFKMRCSVCQHIFEHTIDRGVSLDQEFDLLLSSRGGSEPARDEDFSFGREGEGITETPVEETTPEQAPQEAPAATESVIRDIDSLLGSAPEEEMAEEAQAAEPEVKRSHFKVVALVVCLFIVSLALLWLFRDKILFFREARQESVQSVMEKGPFFTIEENALSYEILSHEQEGSVLVIKGNIRKITPKPIESVMVEARVYDAQGGLIESRLAYAGIVPDTSEFTRQPQRDIDALLTSDPASPGSMLPAGDIPFAVAFFGKPAQEGTSFKVEVKELRWK